MLCKWCRKKDNFAIAQKGFDSCRNWWHDHRRSWSLIPADSWQWRGQKVKPLYVTSYLCLFDFEMLFKLSLTATVDLIMASATHCKDCNDSSCKWDEVIFWGELSFQRDTVAGIWLLLWSVYFLPWQPNQRHSAWTVKIDTITDFYIVWASFEHLVQDLTQAMLNGPFKSKQKYVNDCVL